VGLVRALRYALLVLVAAEGVPLLLRRWLPVGEVRERAAPERVTA
ncbi:phosphoesterase, partial [Deinococcus sp. 23YEL01]|nr:phosphoesterase [Deinococcus sp. 23YEL01]